MATLTQPEIDFIRSLADETGHISAHRVLNEARDPTCVIHGKFIWDDARAGEKFRLEQAEGLVKIVRLEVVIARQTVVVPHYPRDPTRPPREKSFIDITRIGLDPDLTRRVIASELDRIEAQVKRLRSMAEVLGVAATIDELLCNIIKATSRFKKAAGGKRRGRPRKAA